MNRLQYAEMLKDIHDTRTSNGDVAACIANYREKYKYVYIYNDSCFRKIFGAFENRGMTASFLNAILKLDGADCISSLDFMDPSVPGGPYVKEITSDLVAQNQDSNRIVIEVQHKGDSSFKDRLVFYTACHTLRNKVPGAIYELKKMEFIALQMFDAGFASKDYRHSIQLRDQNNELFWPKHTLTIVEIQKFLNGNYAADDSRLAQWLRSIDCLNKELDIKNGDQQMLVLQNAARLSNFDMDYLISEAKFMNDIAYD